MAKRTGAIVVKVAHWNLVPKWTAFAVWTLIVGLVAGIRVLNNSLFNQMNQWTVLMSETYRVFANPNCDRNSGVGCPSTIAVAIPQEQISGSTMFLWIFFLPGAAYFFNAVHSYWHERNGVTASPVEKRLVDDIVFVGQTGAELFYLAYLRNGLGDVSLYSTLYSSGLWVLMRVYQYDYLLYAMNQMYSVITGALVIPDVKGPTKQLKLLHWFVHYVQLVCRISTMAVAYILFWATMWLTFVNAFSSTRPAYLMSFALFFSLQAVQDLTGAGLALYYFGDKALQKSKPAVAQTKPTEQPKSLVDAVSVYAVHVNYLFMSVTAVWMIKMFSSVFPLLYADASTGNTIPYLLGT